MQNLHRLGRERVGSDKKPERAPMRLAFVLGLATLLASCSTTRPPASEVRQANTNGAVHGSMQVDASSFPAPYTGRPEELLIQGAVARPSADGSGDFRTVCLRSHFSFDDPIVYPGQ